MSSEAEGARSARGPYRNGVKRRREIVMAAALAFGQYGYHGASLRQIADHVGTTNATLIAYFGSKEGLLIAVLEHWREETAPETDVFEPDHVSQARSESQVHVSQARWNRMRTW